MLLKKLKFRKSRKNVYSDNGSKNTHINFRKDQSMGTWSKHGGAEIREDFSMHSELKNDKIRLKNLKFE